ncbi:MAG TPA: hypothetical protein VL404_01695 [Candidatus Eisenbacteria bacterium]|nr:hypothetical protein [Candidatus Eisenbacteria bacterium]
MHTDTETPQPLDAIMSLYGLSNADLVTKSTEQLTFKMVAKGRRGRRVSPNVQEKILNALLAAKPDLRLRRRDLFRYTPPDAVVEAIESAVDAVSKRKIKYPQFIDRLAAAGIHGYTTEVAISRVTFYGPGGEAYIKQGPVVSQEAPGHFDADKIQAAIADVKKASIDHQAFLKRIHEAGVGLYDVNIQKRTIKYKGAAESYKEMIPLADAPEPEAPPAEKKAPKPAANKAKAKKKKNPGVVRMTRKGRLTLRKAWRVKKKKARGPKKGKVTQQVRKG